MQGELPESLARLCLTRHTSLANIDFIPSSITLLPHNAPSSVIFAPILSIMASNDPTRFDDSEDEEDFNPAQADMSDEERGDDDGEEETRGQKRARSPDADDDDGDDDEAPKAKSRAIEADDEDDDEDEGGGRRGRDNEDDEDDEEDEDEVIPQVSIIPNECLGLGC